MDEREKDNLSGKFKQSLGNLTKQNIDRVTKKIDSSSSKNDSNAIRSQVKSLSSKKTLGDAETKKKSSLDRGADFLIEQDNKKQKKKSNMKDTLLKLAPALIGALSGSSEAINISANAFAGDRQLEANIAQAEAQAIAAKEAAALEDRKVDILELTANTNAIKSAANIDNSASQTDNQAIFGVTGQVNAMQNIEDKAFQQSRQLNNDLRADRLADNTIKQTDANIASDKKVAAMTAKLDKLNAKQNAGETLSFKDTSSLRKEYNTSLKEAGTDKSIVAYGRIKNNAANPSAMGDLSLIFNFMKTLDPNSVVRESEFKSVADARAGLSDWKKNSKIPMPTSILQTIQKYETGVRLTPEQRQDLVNVATQSVEPTMRRVKDINDRYRGITGRNKGKVEDVIDSGIAKNVSDFFSANTSTETESPVIGFKSDREELEMRRQRRQQRLGAQ